ncbi:MAG: hypothetical protein ACYS0G_13015, partial [Planctomycetota bacterium]
TTAPGRFVFVEEKRWVPWYSALAENHEAQDVRLPHRGSAEDGGTTAPARFVSAEAEGGGTTAPGRVVSAGASRAGFPVDGAPAARLMCLLRLVGPGRL